MQPQREQDPKIRTFGRFSPNPYHELWENASILFLPPSDPVILPPVTCFLLRPIAPLRHNGMPLPSPLLPLGARPMQTFYKSQDIIGKTVVNEDGVVIGEVHDYIVNTETWQISDLQVTIEKKKAKELGLKTPFFSNLRVLIDVGQVQSMTDQIILGLASSGFKSYVEQRKAAAKGEGQEVEVEEEG